mmetsp:Transcript_3504/g.9142  ORF Transcript_3504/g.9142 Transcript_3504/m.9142 type:complete len:298 (-) Transcript_3504:720-1613(-)
MASSCFSPAPPSPPLTSGDFRTLTSFRQMPAVHSVRFSSPPSTAWAAAILAVGTSPDPGNASASASDCPTTRTMSQAGPRQDTVSSHVAPPFFGTPMMCKPPRRSLSPAGVDDTPIICAGRRVGANGCPFSAGSADEEPITSARKAARADPSVLRRFAGGPFGLAGAEEDEQDALGDMRSSMSPLDDDAPAVPPSEGVCSPTLVVWAPAGMSTNRERRGELAGRTVWTPRLERYRTTDARAIANLTPSFPSDLSSMPRAEGSTMIPTETGLSLQETPNTGRAAAADSSFPSTFSTRK